MNENKNQHELNVCLDECLLYIHSFLKGKKTVVKTLQIGLADGKLANTIVNATQKPHIVVDPRQEMRQFSGIKFLKAENIGISRDKVVRDLWLHQDLGKIGAKKSFTIPAHGIVVLKTN
ncbi:MAG TPA: hypothetical protein PLJ37_07270 [Chitinophagales bacterium]|nr:hypothetical protein [Chitinophagales bacterium]HMU98912.1 hypothetical protein [Chitinophagales bacterium]HMY43093.1 hypothetical protein [Chitinophagales bacterium]HMZ94314.1 hypothetical protein [Chitinophagales bacterium]HNB39276.1 hypothetical protein [Chitinophagales bacterium]